MSEGLDARGPGGGSGEREEGRIGLLMGALLLVVAVFVMVSSAVTAVSIEDRRLLACADRVAAAAAGVVESRGYFSREGSASLVISEKEFRGIARQALASFADSTCRVGEGVELLDLVREGDAVRVEVGARASLPLVPEVLRGVSAPELRQWSRARAHARE